MVHSTNAKCAEMANRLFAINRWCVTGTPVGRTIADLQGLFAFIREEPFNEKRWFNQLLYEPYKSGNKKPMVDALAKVLWRTTKRFVLEQINIPKQTEIIHWLSFSQFETHLYERVIANLKQFRHEQYENSDDSDVFQKISFDLELDELDRESFNKVFMTKVT
jgi:E3 ubiquitin-protein ligase SHPRH